MNVRTVQVWAFRQTKCRCTSRVVPCSCTLLKAFRVSETSPTTPRLVLIHRRGTMATKRERDEEGAAQEAEEVSSRLQHIDGLQQSPLELAACRSP